MQLENLKRMIELAERIFDARNDPDQLNVNPEVIDRLRRIHPDTVSEYNDGNGPVAWLLLIPTTYGLMNRFLERDITEKELFDLTPLDISYEAVYLCSAQVLEEYRRKGIIKRLALRAIEKIRKDHPIRSLFAWPFTPEGEEAAETIARLSSLPLYMRRE